MRKAKVLKLGVLLLVILTGSASAIPRLQTYIVDSDYYYRYNSIDSRSWVTNSRQFDLKVVGYWSTYETTNLAGGGSSELLGRLSAPAYDFMDCYVAISTPFNQSGTVWINGVEINTFLPYYDAVPAGTNPAWYIRETAPSMYGRFNFYNIGRLDNDQINAWSYDHGIIGNPGWGDEALMNVVVRGFDWTHFDAIGVDAKGRTFTNDYCHDSSYFATPEPGTLGLLGIGLLGAAPLLRKKKRSA